MAVIKVPSSLRALVEGQSSLQVPQGSVRAWFDSLSAEHPQLATRLLDGGELRKFFVICKNGVDIRTLSGPDTIITSEDELAIIAAVAGG